MNAIVEDIRPTFGKMISAIKNTSNEDFNKVPFPNSWTPAQTAQHVKRSVKGLPDILQGKTQPSHRAANEKVKMVAGVFLDFDTKMKSPEFIEPEMRDYDKAKMLEFYEVFPKQLEELASELDLSAICLDFEIPGFGPMTRLEWIAFAVFHTQRHTRQIENMQKESV